MKRRVTEGKWKTIWILGVSAVLCVTATAPSRAIPIFFVGVSNHTEGDPDGSSVTTIDNTLKVAAATLGQTYNSTVLKETPDGPVGGAAINDALKAVQSKAQPGDIVIFYYLGHGGRTDGTAGKEDKDDDTDKALTKGDEFIGTTDDKLTDDDLGKTMGGFGQGVHKVVITDACFSGGLVGGADDMDRSTMRNLAWLLSVREDQADQGLYEYGAWLAEALSVGADGKYRGDANKDGDVTIEEWLTYADEKRTGLNQGGSIGSTDWLDSSTMGYVIKPEPSSLAMLGLGWVMWSRRRRS